MAILYPISVIGSLVCLILVLIPLFKSKGVLHGILGILCSLYPFIWGWIHAKDRNLSKVMIVWTVCIVLSMVSGAAVSASMMKMIQEQQAAQSK